MVDGFILSAPHTYNIKCVRPNLLQESYLIATALKIGKVEVCGRFFISFCSGILSTELGYKTQAFKLKLDQMLTDLPYTQISPHLTKIAIKLSMRIKKFYIYLYIRYL